METLTDGIIRIKPRYIETGKNYRKFKRKDLGDLLNSIERRGLIQPIIVTNSFNSEDSEKKYALVAGERRLRCCEILGRDVDAIYKPNLTEEQVIAIQLAENTKRHINPGEMANSAFNFYKNLVSEKLGTNPKFLDNYSPADMQEYREKLTLTDFSAIIGRSESTIRDYFAFVSLDKKIQELVIKNRYSFGKAVAISKLPEDKQLLAVQKFNGRLADIEEIVSATLDEINKKNGYRYDNFELIIEEKHEPKKNIELIHYLSSANRVLIATLEYIKYKQSDTNVDVQNIAEKLYMLNSIKKSLEAKLNQGRLKRILSAINDGTSQKDLILKKNFNIANVSACVPELKLIDLSLLDDDVNQPRQTYDPEGIKDLEESINEIGQIQPLVVSKNNARYDVVDGHRRLMALRNIGVRQAICLTRELSPVERRILQFEAEFHEEDRPDERASAIHKWVRLREEQARLNGSNLKKQDIADKLGMSRSTLRTAYGFVESNNSIKDMYRKGLLTYNAAAELSKLRKNVQRKAAFMTYINGRDVDTARRIVACYSNKETYRRNLELFNDADLGDTMYNFEYVLDKNVTIYLHNTSLERLESGDLNSILFARNFYSLIDNMEKLYSYIKKKKKL